MDPVKNTQTAIEDLLDVLLEKGLILKADLIISVANIPLIGIDLRAAIAGMETMLKYGFMRHLDYKTREWALNKIRDQKLKLGSDEQILEDLYGSYHQQTGIYNCWQAGRLYLTDKRIIIYRRLPAEILFSVLKSSIKGVKIVKDCESADINRDILALYISDSKIPMIYSENPDVVLSHLHNDASKKGRKLLTDFKAGDLNAPGD